MPTLGEIKNGRELYKKGDRSRFIWVACEMCGKERWVTIKKGKPKHSKCSSCCQKGKIPWNYKGGRVVNRDGYIYITMPINSEYIGMVPKCGKALEHRIVMAQHLGRLLTPFEQVHHISGDKQDNRIENLELISPHNHTMKTKLCNDCGLRKEIKMLKWQIRQLNEQIRTLNLKSMGVD